MEGTAGVMLCEDARDFFRRHPKLQNFLFHFVDGKQNNAAEQTLIDAQKNNRSGAPAVPDLSIILAPLVSAFTYPQLFTHSYLHEFMTAKLTVNKGHPLSLEQNGKSFENH
jgi:hypothetical protein